MYFHRQIFKTRCSINHWYTAETKYREEPLEIRRVGIFIRPTMNQLCKPSTVVLGFLAFLSLSEDQDKKRGKRKNAQTRNRTRGSSMATMNFTTKPFAPHFSVLEGRTFSICSVTNIISIFARQTLFPQHHRTLLSADKISLHTSIDTTLFFFLSLYLPPLQIPYIRL